MLYSIYSAFFLFNYTNCGYRLEDGRIIMKGIRKIGFKKIAAFFLAAVICMQITACGGGDGGNTTAKKEFVYVPEYQKISGTIDSIDKVNIIEDTIYFTGGEYDEASQVYTTYLCALKIGEKEPVKIPLDFGLNSSIINMGVDTEGNLQAAVVTSIYEETAEGTGDGGAETVEGTDDGEAETAEGTEGGEGETAEGTEDGEAETAEGTEGEEAGAAEETEDGEVGAARSSTVRIGGGGAVISESVSDVSYSAGNDDYIEPVSQKTELFKLSTEGEVISAVDIGSSLGEDVYIQYLETDKEGNIYIGYDQKIYVLNKEGKELFQIELESWLHSMFATKDGTVMVSYYGQEGLEAHSIDLAKKGVGEADKNLMIAPYGNYVFSKGTDADILYSAENTLYSYSFGDEAPEQILNWIDCDINSDDLRSFAVLPDGRILAVTSYWENETNTIELIYLTKKKGSEVAEKKILTYGTMYLAYDIRKQIIDFNKTNQEYRIEVKQYVTDLGSADSYGAGQTQMNADLVSGNGPDIFDLSGTSISQMGEMGILEDLYIYLDNDPDLKREDYLPNVLKAFESDGKLCAIASRFYIDTILAKASDVGERRSITLDELMRIVDEMPEGTDLYQYSTKDVILSYNIMMNMDEYIDWATGECKFNTGEFEKALEFSNKFDSEFNYNEDQPGTATRLHDGSLLMMNVSISGVEDYQMYEGMFGEPVAFVGYPTNKENGSFLSASSSTLGMNSKSKYKDGAWQFMRMGITKEAQEGNGNERSWGFPIMKSALEAQFKENMTENYYEDENGNKVKQPKTSWGYDDFNLDIYAATEEQVAVVRELIDSVDTLYQYNEAISNIISEETAAFFEGQKKAKEVADIVQNRVQIYVNENR